MQSNTTGYLMETFLSIAILCVVTCLTCMIYSLSKKVKYLEMHCEFYKRKFISSLDSFGADLDEIELKTTKMSGQLDFNQESNYRSLQTILERLDAAKPIRPNNWDSIKEAFKGPARVEINERN